MSIASVLEDNELELMSSKVVNGKKYFAINTSEHNSYTLDYMLIIIPIDSDNSISTMYAYFTEVSDLFYFFDNCSWQGGKNCYTSYIIKFTFILVGGLNVWIEKKRF